MYREGETKMTHVSKRLNSEHTHTHTHTQTDNPTTYRYETCLMLHGQMVLIQPLIANRPKPKKRNNRKYKKKAKMQHI